MQVRHILLAAIASIALAVFHNVSSAQMRIALVIGNSEYKNLRALDNPGHDATLVADALKKGGFDTVLQFNDLDRDAIIRVLGEFERLADKAEVALVYYAGHGIEVDGKTFIVPTDGAIEKNGAIENSFISMGRVLVALEGAQQLRVLVLDACRDSPFLSDKSYDLGSRSIGRGLGGTEAARIAAETSAGRGETLVAYAAKHGEIALDGTGTNSPFAAAFADRIRQPGIEIRTFFSLVREDVIKATQNKQEPYTYSTLSSKKHYINTRVSWQKLAREPDMDDGREFGTFEQAAESGTVQGWEWFLAMSKAGPLTEIARRERDRLASLDAVQTVEERRRQIGRVAMLNEEQRQKAAQYQRQVQEQMATQEERRRQAVERLRRDEPEEPMAHSNELWAAVGYTTIVEKTTLAEKFPGTPECVAIGDMIKESQKQGAVRVVRKAADSLSMEMVVPIGDFGGGDIQRISVELKKCG